MLHQERSREIDAPPDQVWSVLRRFMHIDEFSPRVTSVDPITAAKEEGVGAMRRCHFTDGSTVDEEVIDWRDGRSFRVQMKGKMPLKEAYASLGVDPLQGGRSRIYMKMDFTPKGGPFGWLMAQLMMKRMFGRIQDEMLRGLEYKSVTGISVGTRVPQLTQ